MTRCLTEQFAVGALRRGAQIEQFLGATDPSGPPGVAWVVVWPRSGRLVVSLHEVAEVDDGERRMLEHHPALDDDEEYAEGRELGVRDDPLEAMALPRRSPVRPGIAG
jgi:hypothetical protein